MLLRYIGRTTNYEGKPLYELLFKLKKFGVGRMVIRNSYQKYEEPCYFVISKVTQFCEDHLVGKTIGKVIPEKNCNVSFFADEVFRGRNVGERHLTTGYKSDWKLVPKYEESLLKNKFITNLELKLTPSKLKMPPLMEKFAIESKEIEGIVLKNRPMMKTCIVSSEIVGLKDIEDEPLPTYQEIRY